MDSARIFRLGSAQWQEILDKPCAPTTVQAIQTIAQHNARIYEDVFQHTPRDGMKSFDDTINLKFHTVPYAAIYNTYGDVELEMLDYDLKHGWDPRPNYTTKEQWAASYTATKQLAKEGVTGPVGNVQMRNGLSFGGVVPPALKKKFMTGSLLPHQKAALNEKHYTRRQQLFADGSVHDVDAAIQYLRSNIVGFFVAAPLDWGRDQKIKGDPSKASLIRVDIAESSAPKADREEA